MGRERRRGPTGSEREGKKVSNRDDAAAGLDPVVLLQSRAVSNPALTVFYLASGPSLADEAGPEKHGTLPTSDARLPRRSPNVVRGTRSQAQMSVSTSGTGSRIVGQHGEMSYDLIGRLTCWPGTDLEQNRDTTWKGDGRELATLDVAVAPYATYISAPSRWFQALTAAKR
jgi:hypothetical protein